jgi:hypothetical protein
VPSDHPARAHPHCETAQFAVHLKVTRTAVHDLVLHLQLPRHTPASLPTLLQHLDSLPPDALAAACTDDTVDRITTPTVLDVLDVTPVPDAPTEGAGYDG